VKLTRFLVVMALLSTEGAQPEEISLKKVQTCRSGMLHSQADFTPVAFLCKVQCTTIQCTTSGIATINGRACRAKFYGDYGNTLCDFPIGILTAALHARSTFRLGDVVGYAKQNTAKHAKATAGLTRVRPEYALLLLDSVQPRTKVATGPVCPVSEQVCAGSFASFLRAAVTFVCGCGRES